MPANAKKKTYRSHHKDYRPFLRYIESNTLIADAAVNRMKNKLSRFSSNKVNTKDNTKMSTQPTASTPTSSVSSFSKQRKSVMTKKERDDARHAELHDVKHSDLEDNDKIFLLKREIDNLNAKISAQKSESSSSKGVAVPVFNNNVPLLTVLLFFGVVLMSAKFLSRKLRLMRAQDSLLLDGDEGEFSVELREHPSSTAQPAAEPSGGPSGVFAAMATKLAGTSTPSYEAPSAQDASIQFV